MSDDYDDIDYHYAYQDQLDHQKRVLEIQTLIRYHRTLVDCLETELKVMELGLGKRRVSSATYSRQNPDVPF